MEKQTKEEEYKIWVFICVLAAIGITLLAIMTMVMYEVNITGRNIESFKQWEPICYGLLALFGVVGAMAWFALEGGEDEQTRTP